MTPVLPINYDYVNIGVALGKLEDHSPMIGQCSARPVGFYTDRECYGGWLPSFPHVADFI